MCDAYDNVMSEEEDENINEDNCMEISILVQSDGNKIKYSNGHRVFELTRSQLDMGIRLLDAIEGNSTPAPNPQIPNYPSVSPQPLNPSYGPTCNSNPNVDTYNRRSIEAVKRSRPSIEKAKIFAQSIQKWQTEYEETDGNKKGGLSEWAIKKAIVEHKGQISKEEMYQVLKKLQTKEIFEVCYDTANNMVG